MYSTRMGGYENMNGHLSTEALFFLEGVWKVTASSPTRP